MWIQGMWTVCIGPVAGLQSPDLTSSARLPQPASRQSPQHIQSHAQSVRVPGGIPQNSADGDSSGLLLMIIIIIIITSGPMNTSACQLFAHLGRKISSASGDDREEAFLFQRVSVLVQRYNAVLLHDTLPATDCTD